MATHQIQPTFSLLKNSTKRNQILKSNILGYRGILKKYKKKKTQITHSYDVS